MVAACGDHTVPMESLAFPCFYRKAPNTHLFAYSHLHVGVLEFLTAFCMSDGIGGSFVTLFFTFREKCLFSKLIRNGSAIVLSGPLFRHRGKREETNLIFLLNECFSFFSQRKVKNHSTVFPKASFTHSEL